MRHGSEEAKYTTWHRNEGGNGGEPFTATTHQRIVNTGVSSAKPRSPHPVTCQLAQGILAISVFEFLGCCSVVKRFLLPWESYNE